MRIPRFWLMLIGAAFSGVLGKPVTVEATQQGLDSLANMTVMLMDGTGATLDSAKGAALMENPINAVLWLAADLKKHYHKLCLRLHPDKATHPQATRAFQLVQALTPTQPQP